jgi:hypothetical protein
MHLYMAVLHFFLFFLTLQQPKHLTVDMGNVRDPTRQPPPESPAMMSSNCKYPHRLGVSPLLTSGKGRAMNAPRSPAFTSTNCEYSDLT